MNNFGEAVILCGGKSSRMGFDKSLAKINGTFMIDVIRQRLCTVFESVKLCISAATPKEKFNCFGLPIIEDVKEGGGPAVAILSALLQSTTTYIFVVGCDMPFLNSAHISFMKNKIENGEFPDACIPMNDSNIEPLYGFYSVNMIKMFDDEIDNGSYKIATILQKCNTMYLEEKNSRLFDNDLAMFTNLNYKKDFKDISLEVLP